jgi:hypothetical protein
MLTATWLTLALYVLGLARTARRTGVTLPASDASCR